MFHRLRYLHLFYEFAFVVCFMHVFVVKVERYVHICVVRLLLLVFLYYNNCIRNCTAISPSMLLFLCMNVCEV